MIARKEAITNYNTNKMKTQLLRTDGGGSSTTDKRLKLLADMLEYRGQCNSWDFSKVELLHDHKGLLTVTWKEQPNIEDIWELNSIWQNFFLEERPTHVINQEVVYDRDFNY